MLLLLISLKKYMMRKNIMVARQYNEDNNRAFAILTIIYMNLQIGFLKFVFKISRELDLNLLYII